jgi:hypothetical protein
VLYSPDAFGHAAALPIARAASGATLIIDSRGAATASAAVAASDTVALANQRWIGGRTPCSSCRADGLPMIRVEPARRIASGRRAERWRELHVGELARCGRGPACRSCRTGADHSRAPARSATTRSRGVGAGGRTPTRRRARDASTVAGELRRGASLQRRNCPTDTWRAARPVRQYHVDRLAGHASRHAGAAKKKRRNRAGRASCRCAIGEARGRRCATRARCAAAPRTTDRPAWRTGGALRIRTIRCAGVRRMGGGTWRRAPWDARLDDAIVGRPPASVRTRNSACTWARLGSLRAHERRREAWAFCRDCSCAISAAGVARCGIAELEIRVRPRGRARSPGVGAAPGAR